MSKRAASHLAAPLRVSWFCDESTNPEKDTTMNKASLDAVADMVAVKYVLEHVAKIAFLAARLQPEHASQMRANAKEVLREETFPGVDAVLADHFSDEVAHRVDQLLAGIEEKVRDAYQAPPKAT